MRVRVFEFFFRREIFITIYNRVSTRRAETDFCSEGPTSGIRVAVLILNLRGDGVGVTTVGAAEAVGSRAGSSILGTEAEACTGGG